MTALIFVAAAMFSLQVGFARAQLRRHPHGGWRRAPIGQIGRPAVR
jgi:hypothetical protein